MSEFGEPWKESNGTVRDSTGAFVMGEIPCITEDAVDYVAPSPDNTDRIVAAVNFCRNLPTEWLQKHVASSDQSSFGKFSADDRIFVKENKE